jgi:hypothetical protein
MSLDAIRSAVARDLPPSGGDFIQVARALTEAKGVCGLAASIATRNRALRAAEALKAAVTAGRLDGATWGDEVALGTPSGIIAAFLHSLQQLSLFDAVMTGGATIVPMRQNFAMVSGAITASSLGEGALVPIGSISVSSDQLAQQKVIAAIVITNELLRLSGAPGDPFGDALRRSVALETDKNFLRMICNGIGSPVTSTGTSAKAARRDLHLALATMQWGSTASIFVAMSPANCEALSLMGSDGPPAFPDMTPTGGRIGGMRVMASDALAAATDIVLVDASSIVGNQGDVQLDTLHHASVQMAAPPDSPQTAATVLQSLFQLSQVLLAATRFFSAAKWRTDGVALIHSASYAAPA